MEQLYLRKNLYGRPKVIMPTPQPKRLWKIYAQGFCVAVIVLTFIVGFISRYIEVNNPTALSSAPRHDLEKPVLVAPTATPTVEVLSRVFTPTVLYWESLIVETAWRYGFDPNLLAIIVQIESCGDPQALSHAGAMGLGQVMPYHFAAGENPYDPATNLNRGAAYYAAGLKSSNNDIGLSFAGYNGGHGTVQKGRGFWAAETVKYHTFATAIFWDIKNGATISPTIRDRYAPSALCAQAAARIDALTP